jgi:type VI secretion system protein ImpF
MAASASQPGVTASILDRLTDFDPQLERRSGYWQDVRDLKASVCRDLAALLNTRRAEEDFDPVFEEAANSLLTFGVLDFTGYNLKNGIEQEQLRRSMERSIRLFEPRLSRVTVSLEAPDPVRPLLRFQISGLLRIHPALEPVVFDATVHRDSRRIAVSRVDE